MLPCDECHGSGIATCPECKGRGYVRDVHRSDQAQSRACATCCGRKSARCTTCGGIGWLGPDNAVAYTVENLRCLPPSPMSWSAS
jgi:DnaJ-class molecular chaperone